MEKMKFLAVVAPLLLSVVSIGMLIINSGHAPNHKDYEIPLDLGLAFGTNPPPEQESVIVEVTWPKEMRMNDSGSITVVLRRVPKANRRPENPTDHQVPYVSPTVTPSVETERRQSRVSSAIVLPTPTPKQLEKVYEPVEMYAANKIAASNLSVSPSTPDWQSIENPRVEWRWNISPKQSGSQIVNASIEVELRQRLWDAKDKAYKEMHYAETPLWLDELPINVSTSWFGNDSINITALVTGTLGIVGVVIGASVSAIPGLLRHIRERRARRKSQNKSQIGF